MNTARGGRHAGLAALALAGAALAWGAFYPFSKAVLDAGVDPIWMMLLRFLPPALFFGLLLAFAEGFRAFRLSAKDAVAMAVSGALGIWLFNTLLLVGLSHTTATHGAILMGLQPALAAGVSWALTRVRPPGYTLAAIAVALLGAGLVVTQGHPGALLADANALVGDALVLGGTFSWIFYTRSGAWFPGFSPLRFSALSTILGTLGVAVVVALATLAGWAHPPHASTVLSVWPQLGFVVVVATIAAVLAWNWGVSQRGALDAALFINLTPVGALGIAAVFGARPGLYEIAGVLLVLVALGANALLARRAVAQAAPPAAAGGDEPKACCAGH